MKIYHYTRIDILALILKNKTIRFNSLYNVDDPREGDSKDLGKLGHHILVSCWTESDAENIAMWQLYANKDTGCIISMNKEMFLHSNMDPNKKNTTKILDQNEKVEIRTAEKPLIKIKYINDLDKQKFYYENHNGDIYLENLNIAAYKSIEWEFQKEIRYILYQMPKPKYREYYYENEIKDKISKTSEYSYEFYDLPIDEQAFNEMEIITAPNISVGNKIIVEDLCRCYNSNAKIYESKCKIK